jgi:hypothetical protein
MGWDVIILCINTEPVMLSVPWSDTASNYPFGTSNLQYVIVFQWLATGQVFSLIAPVSRYNYNIVKSGVKHHKPNQSKMYNIESDRVPLEICFTIHHSYPYHFFFKILLFFVACGWHLWFYLVSLWPKTSVIDLLHFPDLILYYTFLIGLVYGAIESPAHNKVEEKFEVPKG